MFRSKLMRLYKELEDNLEVLCKDYKVEINCWYNPSTIPQPKFMFGKVVIDADTLYDEDEFNLLFSPKGVLNNRQTSMKKPTARIKSQ